MSTRQSGAGKLALALIGLLVGWVSASAFATPDLGGRFSAELSDGVREFCTDSSPVNVSSPLLDPRFEGFPTSGAAADAFVADIRATADVPQAHPEYAHLLADALAPSREFRFSSSVVVDDHLTYFDLDVENDGILEARLLIEGLPDGGFAATVNYICDSTLVDPTKSFQAYYDAVEVGQ